VERAFWRLIAAGVQTSEAAAAVGVADGLGRRWFRESGGMAPLSLKDPVGRYLSFAEREEIAVLRGRVSVRQIARQLGRSPSTISRELARNSPSRSYEYRATSAQARAEQRARRPKAAKLAGHEPLRRYVQDKLAGPARWSPEQVARRLLVDFPDDERMRISHEAIYQALYVQGRGALRRELAACLRTGRAVRKPRRRTQTRGRRGIPPELLISSRPAEVADRAVPGHWEGDLILGAHGRSAIGTLVERSTRFTMLVHLPQGHGAEQVAQAITTTITTLPEHLRRSLTWDQGVELARHRQISVASDLQVYFCDPHSPWQRGTNENTNGLLRQYFPKGTDLHNHTRTEVTDVAEALNSRPRKTLNWQTPAEALAALLSAPTNEPAVATTD